MLLQSIIFISGGAILGTLSYFLAKVIFPFLPL